MSAVYAPPLGVLDFFKVVALGLVLVAAQGALAPKLGGAVPEAALMLVVFVTWRAEKWMAVLAAFILGLFRDAAGSGPLGVYQVALILMAWFFHPWCSRVHLEASPPLMLSVFSLTLGGAIFILAPLTALLGWPGPGFNPLPAFLLSALTSALAAPPLFWFLARLTGVGRDGPTHG
jgi:rod shape-determining protein MreD